MAIYINGLGSITPVKSIEESIDLNNALLKCKEPDYRDYIEPNLIRRMNRVVKMGIASAKTALKNAAIEMPDAIVMGTGMGCLEDTEKFITDLTVNSEKMLNPSCFINSTHNTISSQIGIILKCHGYNATYSHKGFSFESALLDSMMLLEENNMSNVLVGGADELTNEYYNIKKRIGCWKENIENSLLYSKTKGTLPGEGSVIFCLANKLCEKSIARINFLDIIQNTECDNHMEIRLSKLGVKVSDIDLVILGINGDIDIDKKYYEMAKNVFKDNQIAYYKHLCGEYHTASAFAVMTGCRIIEKQSVPYNLLLNTVKKNSYQNVLIYHHYSCNKNSLILLSKCKN